MVPLPNVPLGWTAGFAGQSDGRRHRTYDREGSRSVRRVQVATRPKPDVRCSFLNLAEADTIHSAALQ